MVVKVIQNLCFHCGGCVPVCPSEALLLNGHCLEADGNLCTGCGICVEACPAGALILTSVDTEDI